MEQEIKINVPEGKKAIYDETSQTITFVDIEPVRSKSWNAFLRNHPRIEREYYINDNGEISVIDTCNRKFPNNLATKEDAEGILALIQLIRLRDEWVGDWEPNWGDLSISKYCIYDYITKVAPTLSCFGYHVLSFPNKEMSIEFFECFKDLILKAKRFL